jgi:hypothetical protein
MPKLFTCTVDGAGASVGNETDINPNSCYLILTDLGGTFQKTSFNASDPIQSQMLAVALAAISTQNQVSALLDPPDDGGGKPRPLQCYDVAIKVD